MAYAITSDIGPDKRSRAASFFAECGVLVALFTAANRVSSAIETARQPKAADLHTLGIEQPLTLPR